MAMDYLEVPLDQNTNNVADESQNAPLSYNDVFGNQVPDAGVEKNPGPSADDDFQLVDFDANNGKEKPVTREDAIAQARIAPLADGVPPNTGDTAKPDTAAKDAATVDSAKANTAKDSAKTDAAKPQSAEERTAKTSSDFEKRGREALDSSHKNLKVTTDGSAPKVIQLQDNFKVQKEATALEIAKEQLGPNAAPDQVKRYAEQLAFSNSEFQPKPGQIKTEQNPEATKFPAGHSIKLPGQTADGGIVTRENGKTTTNWSDGTSLQVHEDGSGEARYSDKNGVPTTIEWNPNDANANRESTSTNDVMTETDAGGTTIEKKYIVTNKADDEGYWATSKISTSDSKGRKFEQQFQPGKPMPEKIVITNPDKSVVELKPNATGEYVSADGKTGVSARFELYSRQTATDGSVTRTYESTGNIEKYNKRGQVVQAEGTDNWGRKAVYDYKPGEQNPNKVTLTTNDGTTVTLNRQRNGKFVGDNLEGGKKVGTVDLGGDGRLIFNNEKAKSARTQLQDGTVLEKRENADKTKTITLTRDKDTFVRELDSKYNRTSETYTAADGRKMTSAYKNNKIDTVKIEGGDRSKTELKYDANAEQLKGQRVDAQGKVVENVSFQEDKLVFVDVKTGAIRAEKIAKSELEGSIPKFVKGSYNKDAGTFTYTNDEGLKTVETFAPGRTDVTQKDGSVTGSTVSGEKSTVKSNGEATVLHANGSGVRLNADLTVDRWGKNPGDNANREKLSPVEENYVKNHKGVDRRDVAELHRRLGGDATKLDAFYKELEKVETAKNLTADERSALCKDILHHAAFPGEIYQGRSPSCNVSVVQRDVVMNSPERYASQIVSAISDGEVTIAGGGKVKLDPANLKLQDSSGRDLASRIYQTMALSVEFDPRAVYRNTEDGVGRIYKSPFNPSDKPEVFAGLNIIQITDARFKLTGEEKALYSIENVAELEAAFKAGGGKPMIIAVNGSAKPFEGNGPVGNGDGANHVVTVVGIENGKVLLHNQWGLASDHATQKTAVDARQLVDNMQKRVKIEGSWVKIPGMVISNGTHDRGYKFRNGRVVEDPAVHRDYKKGVEMMPKAK